MAVVVATREDLGGDTALFRLDDGTTVQLRVPRGACTVGLLYYDHAIRRISDSEPGFAAGQVTIEALVNALMGPEAAVSEAMGQIGLNQDLLGTFQAFKQEIEATSQAMRDLGETLRKHFPEKTYWDYVLEDEP